MILPCEIPQLDIPNEGRNHILEFFLIPIRKIISVQEIYSDSFFYLLAEGPFPFKPGKPCAVESSVVDSYEYAAKYSIQKLV